MQLYQTEFSVVFIHQGIFEVKRIRFNHFVCYLASEIYSPIKIELNIRSIEDIEILHKSFVKAQCTDIKVQVTTDDMKCARKPIYSGENIIHDFLTLPESVNVCVKCVFKKAGSEHHPLFTIHKLFNDLKMKNLYTYFYKNFGQCGG